jgi:hypothetical protein
MMSQSLRVRKGLNLNIAKKRLIPGQHFHILNAMTKQRKVNHNSEIFETFKHVRINIPLLDAIKQAPFYAKFLKDLCTVKRKLNVKKKVFLAEQVSVILHNNNALKYKDPGCPTISCFIGEHKIEKALLDLGASVNLLPYSVFKVLI